MNIIDMSLWQGAGSGGFSAGKDGPAARGRGEIQSSETEIDLGRRGRHREQEQSGEGEWIMPLPEV
jgi:hypothetical protein